MTSPESLVDSYLRAMQNRDYESAVALFADDAVVVHPILGERPVRAFYEELFRFTATDVMTVEHVLVSAAESGPIGLVLMDTWSTPEGGKISTRMVLIFDRDSHDKVSRLTVVFDTYGIR